MRQLTPVLRGLFYATMAIGFAVSHRSFQLPSRLSSFPASTTTVLGAQAFGVFSSTDGNTTTSILLVKSSIIENSIGFPVFVMILWFEITRPAIFACEPGI